MTAERVCKSFSSLINCAIGVIRLRIAPIAQFVSSSDTFREIYASPLRLVLWGSGCLSLLGGEYARFLFGQTLGDVAFPIGAIGVLPMSCIGLTLFVRFENHAALFWVVAGLTGMSLLPPLIGLVLPWL
ncbi:MAG: hypothetical protein LKH33_08395 [Acetobacter sp.]|jgi:hypothetical protein|nr:hypothetical protein [Acetobacter sp.]MCI1485813.1 hypothetical protein [Acetobacter sp.]MCI1529805.1 hypothetical protein [Acetobacter sp.]MCI1587526.1 hypothetical protein [Acetobacter sp.]MCI1601743.1 hypothetical protein [Acetobacter sp.]